MNYGVNGKFPLFTVFKGRLSHANVLVSYCVPSKRLGRARPRGARLCLRMFSVPVVNTVTKGDVGRRVH